MPLSTGTDRITRSAAPARQRAHGGVPAVREDAGEESAMPSAPTWIWSDADGTARNSFALFRRVLELPSRPDHAELHLFASARYRLRVNGEIVGYGPGRFVTKHPEFDSVDLAPWLRAGANVVVVEAWAPNSWNYQIERDSVGGFIAWGAIVAGGRRLDLATPGDWRTRRGTAWDPQAPSYSFVQGPIEILDLAQLPESLFTDPAIGGWSSPSARVGGPWGEPTPRSTPPYAHRLQRFAGLILVAELDDAEERISIRNFTPAFTERREKSGRLRMPYALSSRSPSDQEVEVGLFWGPHWCNGIELKMQKDRVRPDSRENTVLKLRAGENLLYGEPEQLKEVWGQYVGVPRAAGLQLVKLRCGPATPEAELAAMRGAPPATAADLARLNLEWQEAQPQAFTTMPGRDLAWDMPGRVIARDTAANFPLVLRPGSPAGHAIVADFAGEFGGHVAIDVEGPAGTVIDIGIDERLREDRLLGIYRTNIFIDCAERVVLAGGRRSIELFHARGGRYVQLSIRPPRGAAGAVTVHGMAVRDHQAPIARDGRFACSDQLLDWTWETCYRTVQANTEDVLLADSWRERALYISDIRVEAAALAAYSRDLIVARRAWRLWAQAERPNGHILGSAPGWGANGWIGGSLHWIALLHQLWEEDGDLADAAQAWPRIEAMLAGRDQKSSLDGLWDAQGWLFIDWGAVNEDCTGQANAVLNGWRYEALTMAAELGAALGRAESSARLAAEAESVAKAFRQRLWLPDQQRFARRLVDGKPDPGGNAMHANAIALATGLAAPDQVPGALGWLELKLADNAARTIARDKDGALEIFYLHMGLMALYRHGRGAVAEAVIRQHYAPMQSAGAWVCWENLYSGVVDGQNLCQSWAATAAHWLRVGVLGVRCEHGDPSRVVIAPDSALEWAEGASPHPRGEVRVKWRRVAGCLELEASAPSGVHLRVAPGPAFAGLRLVARLSSH
jgi:hypothetical protein